MARGKGKRGAGRGSGQRFSAVSADEIEVRNERLAAFDKERAKRRADEGVEGEGDEDDIEEGDEEEEEEIEEFVDPVKEAEKEAKKAAKAADKAERTAALTSGGLTPEQIAADKARSLGQNIKDMNLKDQSVEYGGNQRYVADDSDEDDAPKKKGTEGLIETSNPNAIKAVHGIKLKDMASTEAAPMSRKEREEKEKADAAERYRKKHELGLTEEYRKDMAKLEAVKKRREDSAAKDAELKAVAESQKGVQDEAREKKSRGGGKEKESSGPARLDKIAIKKMKPALMKEALKERKLDTQGSAKELEKRLVDYEASR